MCKGAILKLLIFFHLKIHRVSGRIGDGDEGACSSCPPRGALVRPVTGALLSTLESAHVGLETMQRTAEEICSQETKACGGFGDDFREEVNPQFVPPGTWKEQDLAASCHIPVLSLRLFGEYQDKVVHLR